ncbi:hypothetical protein HBI56_165690 [Parastagonospora nodorum]|nr:hypothetical protein HBH56_073440 [Parastagonospora nodorum]QRD06693.1 hypothetical protein JI435_136010 [Parastagonospora nodorum SN15]KAH3927288.1 hypothetical protein HBH54_153680 [Parastagonospora nodorum]KAH3981541.1 hypothetical protein HBH51_040440 [Parastagonospora nodorum]KAH3983224.1 hypothetical protein HBH52_068030 [Parastagonospora nodorum]
MHSVTALLPLLVLAAGVLAAPTPLRLMSRGRPNLHEVIRDPTPINAGLHVALPSIPHLLPGLDLNLHTTHPRVVPAVEDDAAPVVVVDRA